jgi:hypothetical protein
MEGHFAARAAQRFPTVNPDLVAALVEAARRSSPFPATQLILSGCEMSLS